MGLAEYQDIASQIITDPSPSQCFTNRARHSGLLATLGILQTKPGRCWEQREGRLM